MILYTDINTTKWKINIISKYKMLKHYLLAVVIIWELYLLWCYLSIWKQNNNLKIKVNNESFSEFKL